eukprot:COSAG04_NODE_4319_length_2158_cov_24.756192_1_plen_200_part_00
MSAPPAGCVRYGRQQPAQRPARVLLAVHRGARAWASKLALSPPPRRGRRVNRDRVFDRSIATSRQPASPARARRVLGNRGSLPSNAAAHVACWRCVPVVPGRGGMCGVLAAHLARRMLQQLPGRARELSPHVTAAGCLSRSGRDRAACGVTAAGLPPLGAPRTPSGTSPARASPRSGEAAALRVGVSALLARQPAAPPY